MSTRLQGAFRAPATGTIRVTDHSGPSTSDWPVTLGDTWQSLDDLLTEWNAQMASDGLTVNLSVTDSATAYTGTIRMSNTSGGTMSVDWAHSGDATAVRDWLGESGNITTQPTPYDFSARHKCGWYVDGASGGARLGTRQNTRRRHTGRQPLLSGSTQTQHNMSTGDLDSGTFDLLLDYDDGTGSQEGASGLETFFDELFDTTGSVQRFTLFYGDDNELSAYLRIAPSRGQFKFTHKIAAGAQSTTHWKTSIDCEVAG